jgi:signal transduction histidine kinase
MLLWIILILPIYTGTILFLVISAYRKNKPESGAILVGITGFILASLTGDFTAFFHLGLEEVSYPLYPWDYGMAFFLVCIMYGMITRFIRARNRMHLLASRILAAHEEERKRLARELHDSLGQNLLAVKFNLQRINQKLQRKEISSIITEIDRSIEELRDISMGLRPAMLAEMGLAVALKLFSKSFTKKTGIHIKMRVNVTDRLHPRIEENLFRIFQEALSNVVRHSDAQEVEVSVERISRILTMQIKDNGRGFKPDEIKSNGIGLSTMAERADLMGGVLRVVSSKGRGATIIVEVPISEKDIGS